MRDNLATLAVVLYAQTTNYITYGHIVSYATIDDLRSQLGASHSPEAQQRYADKMLHPIPDASVVDRVAFILEYCAGKRVLEVGASGTLHDQIMGVATMTYGIDRKDGPCVEAFDLDDVSQSTLPAHDVDLVVCGEVLEHLSNPGWFLTRLKRQYGATPTIFTVPNAFSAAAQQHMKRGVENCNRDHCCWFSFRTIKTLLERHGYGGYRFAWYGGQPLTAEGMVIYCEL